MGFCIKCLLLFDLIIFNCVVVCSIKKNKECYLSDVLKVLIYFTASMRAPYAGWNLVEMIHCNICGMAIDQAFSSYGSMVGRYQSTIRLCSESNNFRHCFRQETSLHLKSNLCLVEYKNLVWLEVLSYCIQESYKQYPFESWIYAL